MLVFGSKKVLWLPYYGFLVAAPNPWLHLILILMNFYNFRFSAHLKDALRNPAQEETKV